MADVFRAFLKALSTALGPLGAPIEGALSLYDDDAAEERNAVLVAKISEGQEMTKDGVEALLALQIKNGEALQQIVNAFHALYCLVLEDKERRRQLLELPAGESSLDEAEATVLPLVKRSGDFLERNGVLTERVLIGELVRLYPRVKVFLAVVRPAGFPHGIQEDDARVAYYQFVCECRGLCRDRLQSISGTLSADKSGSVILRTWASFYRDTGASRQE